MSVVDDDAAMGCRLILAALQLKFKNNGIQSCSSKYANKITKRYKGSRKKRSFYGKDDRKGAGGRPLGPDRKQM